MPYSFAIAHNPRGYSIANGEKNLSWTAEAPHVIQPTPDDGTDTWLERAAQAAVEMFDRLEITEPLERQREQAKEFADAVLMPVLLKQTAETAEMSDVQLVAAGKDGFFDAWAAGQSYPAGKRLVHNDITYIVVQAVATSLAHQAPDADGMLAIYRPVDPATGTADDPKTLLKGMDAVAGLYYRYNGELWKCLRDLIPTFAGRMPGDAGMETFWQKVVVVAGTTQYSLSTSGTYHAAGCSYISESGQWLTLAGIAAARPDAKPCTRCQPPALSEGTSA